jgi:hypothetical protein
MQAKDVNHSKFRVDKIIYETEEFSIAYRLWEDRDMLLGMRWSGENKDDAGYPKLFGNPVWFIIPQPLTLPLTKSLLDVPIGTNKDQLISLLQEIFSPRT